VNALRCGATTLDLARPFLVVRELVAHRVGEAIDLLLQFRHAFPEPGDVTLQLRFDPADLALQLQVMLRLARLQRIRTFDDLL